MAECERKTLSPLEAARSRYESLQISDDVFGESGDDSSENPFYSTSGDSNSDNYTSEINADDIRICEVGSSHPGASGPNTLEEEGWSDTLRDITVPSYKGTCGPMQRMSATATAIDFFQLFVPDNAIQNMVTQTNMYAKKYQERFASEDGWRPVTVQEMRAFLGFVCSTGVHRCESVLSIWSSGFFGNRSIAPRMSQTRFEKILKYFHVVAFRSSQGSQGLYKIQPFLDCLQQALTCTFRPSQTQVLHEPLIDEDPVFITTCTERETRKRKKRKFSLWVRQCTSTGFICQIYVHLKEGLGPDGLDTLKHKPQLHSLVARQLCQNLTAQNAIIFTGPSITSLNLFQEFQKQGIYCCGLLSSRKSDCTGLPQSMLATTGGPPQRGQSRIKMNGDMSLISWYNKGHFRFLTNAYSPTKEGVIIKRKSGEIPCPLAVEAFAAHLGYICKYDDKYSKYFIFHKPNKTWQQVFWLTISIAINNAYILYKMSEAYQVKRYSRAQFGERLVRELLDLDDCSPTQ
ncbi:piggyBac transposable element-derived protein 5 [Brienomyrus brachyistius]|uniref:piggyBac transposable element-derived protein 5 n=1 Tax=Brienomyrus brachyistius TaxID=42636 RepID=UPI0020B2F60D|nr:piggyBac transposable element-derived protein 5 [Brienomyrus brachyistius]XP_048862423.1 piggyBac transposable element-derived protein 5 [Brienomyrus brachyistius]XP_048862424.1 piggyBac transposable element-derived protein 5 [Brienomyrus brachyistius]